MRKAGKIDFSILVGVKHVKHFYFLKNVGFTHVLHVLQFWYWCKTPACRQAGVKHCFFLFSKNVIRMRVFGVLDFRVFRVKHFETNFGG